MEFQVSKKGQPTLMERIYKHCEIPEGFIRSKEVPILLRNLHPELTIDSKELERLIAEQDPNGCGKLDFEAITKIIFNLLMKQSAESLYSSSDSDKSGKTTEEKLTLSDFVIFNIL